MIMIIVCILIISKVLFHFTYTKTYILMFPIVSHSHIFFNRYNPNIEPLIYLPFILVMTILLTKHTKIFYITTHHKLIVTRNTLNLDLKQLKFITSNTSIQYCVCTI